MSKYPCGLRPESDYYPRARGDIIWVFLRDVKPGPDGTLMATYQPAYEGAQWETMPAREFRRRYLRMAAYQHAYFSPRAEEVKR